MLGRSTVGFVETSAAVGQSTAVLLPNLKPNRLAERTRSFGCSRGNQKVLEKFQIFPRKSKRSGEVSDFLEEIKKFRRTFGSSRGNRKVLEKFRIFPRKSKSSGELSDLLEEIEKIKKPVVPPERTAPADENPFGA